MGVYGFIIFWTQKGQFQGEHRGGAFNAPSPPNRIFLTPRQLGLSKKSLSSQTCQGTAHHSFFLYKFFQS